MIVLVGMSPIIFKQYHDHDHAVWEIVLNMKGSGYTVIGGNRYEFSPGTVICQPPNIPHMKYSEEGFVDMYIQSTSFPLAGITNEKGVLLFQDDADKSFESLISMSHRAYHEKKNNYKLLVDSLYESMIQLLISWQHDTHEEKDVYQLKTKLIDSFSNPELNISNLLAEENYCSDHLRRRFKKFTGKTPVEYLSHLRIEYAKKLMSENDILRYSIAEIGAMSGYYDSHYFSRIFKKNTGMTPVEYIARQGDGSLVSLSTML